MSVESAASKEQPAMRRGAKMPPRDNGYRHKNQYGVIVLCADEAEHRRVFEELKAMGKRVRLVCV